MIRLALALFGVAAWIALGAPWTEAAARLFGGVARVLPG